ncbi:MdtA/MuxA family multidrug efflux RND transporter periplasmic adaptor subunit [Desulfovibrio sp. OttesenSCG-928-G15]|nr:MdtA/MuxA family multidrug efflux RND transporter periplasmic adaptor subunit [Desulfovibrio sp. OttesenSCG-928-G15]
MNYEPVRFPLAKIIIGLLVLGAALYGYSRFGKKEAHRGGLKPLAVRVAVVKLGSMDVFIQGLGTVTSPNTVTVKSRVDGQLMSLYFTEGQMVAQGELLAEIDPRPFRTQLQQAKGTLAREQAQLKDAELDLQRYRKLIKEQSVSQQQLQSQEGLVGQSRGGVQSSAAAVAEAELQLSYTRITAPITGRVGLRKVDVGNMIRASDSNGLVVITQIDPMHVIFTLVEKDIPTVLRAMRNTRLEVQAWGQDNKTLLGTGQLLTLDNQIDTATGTVKAKAEFHNADRMLFPNQFVNARLKVATLENALIIPSSAVQRNNNGFFVYAVREGKTRAQNIVTGHSTDTHTVVTSGLTVGEIVVIDGVDRLRDGMPVTYEAPEGAQGRDGSENGQPPARPAKRGERPEAQTGAPTDNPSPHPGGQSGSQPSGQSGYQPGAPGATPDATQGQAPASQSAAPATQQPAEEGVSETQGAAAQGAPGAAVKEASGQSAQDEPATKAASTAPSTALPVAQNPAPAKSAAVPATGLSNDKATGKPTARAAAKQPPAAKGKQAAAAKASSAPKKAAQSPAKSSGKKTSPAKSAKTGNKKR